MKILVTGGAGYIGSHTLICLVEAGYELVVLDNLSNSSIESIRRVEKIVGKTIEFLNADIRDIDALDEIFTSHQPEAVIHFAGLKAVGESVRNPILYYENNVVGSLNLFNAMVKHQVFNLVFSSSATVYGDPKEVPVKESASLTATNPYGRTKLMIEDMLRDIYLSDERWSIALLRYFNPIGAHQSGMIGEDPNGIPNNLLPYIAQVAVGKLKALNVFGNDYPTHDGTGVRDYIHVMDLAEGHVLSLKKITEHRSLLTLNLGTGTGYSVLDLVNNFQEVSGRQIDYQFAPRRSGDVAINYADPRMAAETIGWKASRGLMQMCEDVWKWQFNNPNGYKS
jgi:UDP-glucose 4-epimerase